MNQLELNEYIDELLKLYYDNEYIDQNNLLIFSREHKDLIKKGLPSLVLAKMEYRFGLVKRGQDNLVESWSLTKYGQRVLRHGSWTRYLYNKEELVVEQVNSIIRTNKLQRIILWFTAIFTLTTLIISWFDYRANLKKLDSDQNSRTLTKETEVTESTGTLNSNNIRDSVKNLPDDSLKRH